MQQLLTLYGFFASKASSSLLRVVQYTQIYETKDTGTHASIPINYVLCAQNLLHFSYTQASLDLFSCLGESQAGLHCHYSLLLMKTEITFS